MKRGLGDGIHKERAQGWDETEVSRRIERRNTEMMLDDPRNCSRVASSRSARSECKNQEKVCGAGGGWLVGVRVGRW